MAEQIIQSQVGSHVSVTELSLPKCLFEKILESQNIKNSKTEKEKHTC